MHAEYAKSREIPRETMYPTPLEANAIAKQIKNHPMALPGCPRATHHPTNMSVKKHSGSMLIVICIAPWSQIGTPARASLLVIRMLLLNNRAPTIIVAAPNATFMKKSSCWRPISFGRSQDRNGGHQTDKVSSRGTSYVFV
mmetsp:Transcript_13011/g.21248  ORF Transcript_13011/g.21248 Transcript_13011/m.21248 type:complete len:141 (-) Transcript_13011:1410-1832(-)